MTFYIIGPKSVKIQNFYRAKVKYKSWSYGPPIESIGLISFYSMDKLVIDIAGVVYQAGIDLESKLSEIRGVSYLEKDKIHVHL